MWLDRFQKSNCLYGILVKARDLKRNPAGGILPSISHIGIVNSRLADTPIIQTATKFPGKNKLQTFDLNKLPLLQTVANEDTNLRSLQCPL